jgi:hypothetical protein
MKYQKDKAIEEIRETRREIFAGFKRDPHALGRYLMEMDRSRKGGMRLHKKGKDRPLARAL